jgi:hypothetical protein
LAAEAEDAVDPAEAQSDYTGDQTDKASGAPPICWSSLLWLGRLWCPACGSKDVGWVVPLRLQGALATLRRCRCRDCAHRFRAFWIDVGHAVQILALLCAIALLALLYYQGSGQLAQPPPAPLE